MKVKHMIPAALLLSLLSGCGKTISEAPTTLPAVETASTVATALIETVPVETEAALTEPEDSCFVAVKDYIPDILVELKYATSDNFTGQSVYGFQGVYLRYGTVKKLMAVQQELRELGLRLKIWDGFRPVSAQRTLWDICPDPNYVSHPETGNRSHCRGNTVDITLTDASGYALEMPTGFDDFSERADRDYSDCSEEAAYNAELLEEIMEAYGFTGYGKEWWHFSDNTDYPVEECFDPGVISQWYANCNEFISLRSQPDTSAEVLIRIPAGEEMTLLGYSGNFAMVDYDGRQGYVLQDYIAPIPGNRTESAGQGSITLNNPWYYADCRDYISLRASANMDAEVITQIPAGEQFLLLEEKGEFALVDYNGLLGYVLISYIEAV